MPAKRKSRYPNVPKKMTRGRRGSMSILEKTRNAPAVSVSKALSRCTLRLDDRSTMSRGTCEIHPDSESDTAVTLSTTRQLGGLRDTGTGQIERERHPPAPPQRHG